MWVTYHGRCRPAVTVARATDSWWLETDWPRLFAQTITASQWCATRRRLMMPIVNPLQAIDLRLTGRITIVIKYGGTIWGCIVSLCNTLCSIISYSLFSPMAISCTLHATVDDDRTCANAGAVSKISHWRRAKVVGGVLNAKFLRFSPCLQTFVCGWQP